jgi:hypothetical protein
MAEKIFDSNKPIRLKMLLGEIVSVTGGAQLANLLVATYNSGNTQAQKEERLYSALTFGPVGALLGMDEDELKKEVDTELGGAENLVSIISAMSTFGLEPDPNHLYVLEDSSLGTPPGEYRIGESVNVNGDLYQVEKKSNLSGYIDWMFGIPNFSWIGAFEEVTAPSQTALEMALTPEEWILFQQSGGNQGRAPRRTNGNGMAIPWWVIAAAVLLLVRR